MRLGLIGKTLDHSFSKAYFTSKFEREGIENSSYENCELETIEQFENLKEQDFRGFNVTIPYKEAILPYLDELSEDARKIGAVNTIKKMEDGRWKGFNTDHIGFERSLLPFLEPTDQKALILGTGGASKAVAFALERRGIQFMHVSRDPKPGQLSYSQLNGNILPYVQLIINTTPVGMTMDAHPDVPFELIEPTHFLIDLIYNPEKTIFLMVGEKHGSRTLNGLSMLHHQAEEAWKIWNS